MIGGYENPLTVEALDLEARCVVPVVSVVVPVYNGQPYLERLVGSLMKQTFTAFEVLFVDDCSTDDSTALLSRITSGDERFHLLASPTNLGTAPRAVNLALPQARGDYFVYASQDDFFSPDWLERMADRAREARADATLPDLVFYSGGEDDPVLAGLDGDHTVVLSNREAVELSLDWRIPGCALWRTELVRRTGYADFTFDADEYTVRRLFHASNRVVFSGGTYYYNQTNPRAITKQLHQRWLGSSFTYLALDKFLSAEKYPEERCEEQVFRAATGLVRNVLRLQLAGIAVGDQGRAHILSSLAGLRGPEMRRRLRRYGTRSNGGHLVSQLTTRGPVVFTAGIWVIAASRRLRRHPRRGAG